MNRVKCTDCKHGRPSHVCSGSMFDLDRKPVKAKKAAHYSNVLRSCVWFTDKHKAAELAATCDDYQKQQAEISREIEKVFDELCQVTIDLARMEPESVQPAHYSEIPQTCAWSADKPTQAPPQVFCSSCGDVATESISNAELSKKYRVLCARCGQQETP